MLKIWNLLIIETFQDDRNGNVYVCSYDQKTNAIFDSHASIFLVALISPETVSSRTIMQKRSIFHERDQRHW